MDTPLLTRLLPDDLGATLNERLRAAVVADPALTGRVSCDDAGLITLTGAAGGPPPGSVKERKRWEMHVRLRLAAELGEFAAAAAVIRWAAGPSGPVSKAHAGDERYAAP